MRQATLIVGVYILCYATCMAQESVQFTNVAFEQGIYNYYTSTIFGEGVSFYDFDEDGWDDLTLCNQNDAVYIYRNTNGTFEIWQPLQVPNAKSSVWGDLNNDGSNELIISTLNYGLWLFTVDDNGYYSAIPNAFDWTDMYPSYAEFWLYGMSLADVNGDHLLDLVVANYNQGSQNFLFLNTGQMGFQLYHNNALKYDLKATFQPACIDLNRDFKPDLYMANDFEHGNDFYWNQIGTNDTMPLFEQSNETGLGIQLNSMCNSWCDFDNDGDLDVYVSNLEPGNQLLQNNGNNQFTNIAEQINVAVYRQCWSSLWVDANNDQWNDLLASSANPDWPITWWPGSMMLGTGDGLFTQPDTSIFTNSAFSACKGDFNQDGHYDIALNASNQDFFQLYQNTTINNHHFIKFKPIGLISNKDGVGLHYYLHTAGNTQYGYTQSGDNYLSQNSQNLILGLGENQSIDSLILLWPSGIIDKYFDLPIDQFHTLHEGQSGWGLSLSAEKVCSPEDSVLATMNPLFEVIWNNNLSDQGIWLHPGNHAAMIQYEGEIIDTILFNIELYGNANHTTIITAEHCTAQDGAATILLNNDTLYHVSGLADGQHIVLYNNAHGCSVTDTITVDANDSFQPYFSLTHPACQTGAFGHVDIPEQPNISYYFDPSVEPNALLPGEYTLHFSNSDGCTLDTTISILAQQQWDITMPDTIETCYQQNALPDDWIESNLPIVLYNNWPIESLTNDSTLIISVQTIQGCTLADSAFFNVTFPPDYITAQESQQDGSLISLQVDNNGQAFFQNNGSPQFFCTESQWLNISISEGICQWTDSVWITIQLPQNIGEIPTNEAWYLNQNILFNKTTEKQIDIKKIVNVLGQNISYRLTGTNRWELETGQYPIFILTEDKWTKVHIQQR